MDNEILRELHFDKETGGLFYQEVRYLLIRPETLMAFQKAIEKEMGEKASQIFYQSGFEGGSLSSKKYQEAFGFSDTQIIHFMIEMGSQIGWGKFELERFDPSEHIIIVKGLPFSLCRCVWPLLFISLSFHPWGLRRHDLQCFRTGD